MSRIDYITVGLVALCLAALIYILSKVAGIEGTVLPIEKRERPAPVRMEADTLSQVTDSLRPASDTLRVPLTQKEEEPASAAGEEKRYLVVAASFPEEALAQKELDRLIQLGYVDSEIGYFNQRKIISVIAGRFADYQQAMAFAKKMNDTHKMDAYVHQKRSQ